MAYISFDKKNWQDAQHYFDEAYTVAKNCSETNIAEQCLCNSGIASGNSMMEEKQKMFSTFYNRSGGAAAGGGIHGQAWSDDDEEDEDGEASYGDELRRILNTQPKTEDDF